jgi:hypothetical protein
MGKAKRCRAVVIGASVAALGAAGPCPAANAAAAHAPGAHAPRTAAARKHASRHRSPRPTTARGPYVYEIEISGEIRAEKPNASCAGSGIMFSDVTLESPESPAAYALTKRAPSYWTRRVTITAAPTTTITMPWFGPRETREAEQHGIATGSHNYQATTTAARICAATTPNAALGGIAAGMATWRLPRAASSIAALLTQPPTSLSFREIMVAFEIQPDGSVPAFKPFS